ncbi:unnamed protein product [Rotaria magnacalcarata]|uniref:Uncharacterized protein n=1 Tax=Rotaria magnacalcarata TaxID=392030 RepID=A0A816PTK9_9BILA|nr:unnamed protein product [Rotaria magnacalcarata]CAF1607935.1 unnamed protein product [Rotaria magnacalcarata]CAF2025365.1 unnamed protein product [Rotaria magnacalcarata]CAF2052806.1 unnamed protein product [Rotaria magnacalcarata]
MAKGHQALIKLRFETNCNENNIRLMECDLSSFDSVRNFVSLYNNEEDRLDVLICNAGLVYISTIYSKDSLKYVMKVSYLGPFLLTNLLLDKLKQCQPSRIINVSSVAHQCKTSWTLTRKRSFNSLLVSPTSVYHYALQ